MGRLRTSAVLILTILCALPAAAARDDFYLGLLHRGMSHVDAGQYDAAMRELHIAAFGLVDSIPQFETAHIYITMAANGLKNEADARRSAQRVVAAERIERRYGSLSIPASARQAFDAIAARLLTTDQYAFLRSSPTTAALSTPQPQMAMQTPVIVPAPQPQPMPQPVVVAPVTPAPQPVRTAPQSAAPPSKPAPQPAPRETTIIVPMAQPVPPPTVVERTTTTTIRPAPVPQPAPAKPQPVAPVPRTRPNVDAQLTLADAAIDHDDLHNAANIYRSVLEDPNLTHAQLIRVGEGAYRARDFVDSARALERSGFRGGEEPYRFYYAVALYETGDYAAAKRELAAALPYIEVTREVARYRTKIEGAAR